MFTPGLWRVRRFAENFPEMLNLQRDVNRLFSNIVQREPQNYPAINIWEKDDHIVLTAELPGIDSEKIDISVTGNKLTLSGKSKEQLIEEGDAYLRQEREHGSFLRNFHLPFQVDTQKVEAKYEKGILTITLPRTKEDLPKKVKINT